MHYEEKATIEERDRKKIWLRVAWALVLSYILMNVYATLALPFLGLARLVFIGIAVAGIYFAFRHELIGYVYRIEESKLIFATNNGKYDKVLYEIDAEYVRCISRGKQEPEGAELLNMTKTVAPTACCSCIFADEKGKLYSLVFEPSETYLEKAAAIGIEIR